MTTNDVTTNDVTTNGVTTGDGGNGGRAGDVAAITLDNLLRAARTVGVDVDAVVRGVWPAVDDLSDGRVWVDWTDVVVVVERLVASLDDRGLDLLVARHMTTHPVHRVLATAATGTTAWLQSCWRAGRSLAPVMDVRYDIDDDEHRLTCALRAGRAPCAGWFRVMHLGAVHAAAPLSVRPLSTLSVAHDGTQLQARYAAPVEVVPRGSRRRESGVPGSTVLASFGLLVPALGALFDGHLAASPDLPAHRDEPGSLAARFSLTPSEARVALLLADGARPAAIASTLGLTAETVRGYLKRTYAKTDTSGQRELVDVVRAWRLR